MNRQDSWTAGWVSDKLISHNKIATAFPRGSNHVELSVEGVVRPVLIATMSVDPMTVNDLGELCDELDIQFAMNIKKDALYDRTAIQYSESASVGIGSLGDLYAAANEKEFRRYVPRETRFVLRGLRQHTNVFEIFRLNNRLYQVEKLTGSPVRVLALNEYDLTADAVRDGIERFGECDIVLASNPNCRPSNESLTAAKHSGARVLKWAQLLGALND